MTASTDISKKGVDKNIPDIVIGVVSFVGIDTKPVISSLEQNFERMGYRPIHIKISAAFNEIAHRMKSTMLDNVPPGQRTESYIKFGNEMRKEFGNDFWVRYAVYGIIRKRDSSEQITKGTVYIIDQLKTKDELRLLESIYGKAFFQLSIYSSRDRRVDYIARSKARATNRRNGNDYRNEAEALVNQDYNEKLSYGQNVGKLLQLADVIINADDTEEHPIEKQISRFVELLFGSNKYSPNHMEYGMYLAHSAALRSLDLSRQVGAAIFHCTGEVATLGCNEVPKAGGGTYWAEEKYDAREYRKGSDSNDERKKELLKELEAILRADCSPKKRKILEKILKNKEKALNDSQFMDALEYGRIVHAEMNAITDAARLGISLQDATLYCTTFPCHMCSKLIIASGIKRVLFLEPYPKSLTSDMHPDSVRIEGTPREQYQNYPGIYFSHFYGITASRFTELFQRDKRKDTDNKFQEYKEGTKKPIFAPYQVDGVAEDESATKFADLHISYATPIGDNFLS